MANVQMSSSQSGYYGVGPAAGVQAPQSQFAAGHRKSTDGYGYAAGYAPGQQQQQPPQADQPYYAQHPQTDMLGHTVAPPQPPQAYMYSNEEHIQPPVEDANATHPRKALAALVVIAAIFVAMLIALNTPDWYEHRVISVSPLPINIGPFRIRNGSVASGQMDNVRVFSCEGTSLVGNDCIRYQVAQGLVLATAGTAGILALLVLLWNLCPSRTSALMTAVLHTLWLLVPVGLASMIAFIVWAEHSLYEGGVSAYKWSAGVYLGSWAMSVIAWFSLREESCYQTMCTMCCFCCC